MTPDLPHPGSSNKNPRGFRVLRSPPQLTDHAAGLPAQEWHGGGFHDDIVGQNAGRQADDG